MLDYIRLQYPSVFPYVIKIPNEGRRTAIGTHIMKMEGLHVGASDLFIAWPRVPYCGFWLEIKKDGYTFPASDKKHVERQMEFINQMLNIGYYAKMCVGIDECIAAVDWYLGIK